MNQPNQPCGCRVDYQLYTGNIPDGWQLLDMTICHIVYCSLHVAAEAMREALKNLVAWQDSPRHYTSEAEVFTALDRLWNVARTAIAQAEGKG